MACLSPLGRWMVEHIYDVCSSCGNISLTEEYDICLYCHEMWVMEEHGIKGSNPWKRVISFPYSVRDDHFNLYGSFLPYVLPSEKGLLLVAHGRKLLLCDSKNSTWKNITNYKQVEHYRKEVTLYIETLVSPYRTICLLDLIFFNLIFFNCFFFLLDINIIFFYCFPIGSYIFSVVFPIRFIFSIVSHVIM